MILLLVEAEGVETLQVVGTPRPQGEPLGVDR
jgi:hypothetical protein